MDIAIMKEAMDKRGYNLNYHSADNTSFTYSKHIGNKDCIYATVNLTKDTIRLSAIKGLFTVSSGELDFFHRRFRDFWENRLITMVNAITNAGIEV